MEILGQPQINPEHPNRKLLGYGFLVVVFAVAVFGIYQWQYGSSKNDVIVTNFEECIAAGNPVAESYPRQCRTQNGQSFVEQIDETAIWQTYRNQEYGFEVKYPVEFTIFTALDQQAQEVIPPDPNSRKVKLTDNKAHLFCCEPIISSIEVVDGRIDFADWRDYANIPDYRIKSQGEISFQGRLAYEVVASSGLDSAGAKLIVIQDANNSFVIIQGDDGEVWRLMTESFRFINKDIVTFEQCMSAGNPVMESFPEQCRTSNGLLFTNWQGAGLSCTQVVTRARNPETGETRDYPTPCDVASGWVVIEDQQNN